MATHFTALRVIENPDNSFTRQITQRAIADLPPGEILVKVHYSSLNYKDALSATGNKGITRHYPHTPGIDAAGIVVDSQDSQYLIGEPVVVMGFDLGMNTSGGFSSYIRVPSHWVMKLPNPLSLQESMIYGTAGYTAALSIYKLQQVGLTPEKGKILVTGATGGVGSMAVALLSQLGYEVVAVTGKPEKATFLTQLGAQQVLGREVLQPTEKPLHKPRWAGVVDTVGGEVLATALKFVQYGGAVSTCGMVNGTAFTASMFPFILNSTTLIGIGAADSPMSVRLPIWTLLAEDWKIPQLSQLMTDCCDLTKLSEVYIADMLAGSVFGRIVVELPNE